MILKKKKRKETIFEVLKSRLILYLMIPLLVLSLGISAFSAERELNHAAAQTKEAMDQYSLIIKKEMASLCLSSAVLSENKDFLNELALYHVSDNPYQRLFQYRSINDFLNGSYGYSKIPLKNLYVFYSDGEIMNFRTKSAFSQEKVRNSEWYLDAVSRDPYIYITDYQIDDIKNGSEAADLVLSRRIRETSIPEVEMIAVTFSFSGIRELNSFHNGKFLILNGSGKVLTGSVYTYAGKSIEDVMGITEEDAASVDCRYMLKRIDNEWRYVTSLAIPNLDWRIVVHLPLSTFVERIVIQMLLLVGTIVFFVIVFLRLSRGFLLSICRPIEDVSREIGNVANGDFHGKVTVEGPYEVDCLCHSFNSMVSRLDEVMKERNRLEQEYTRAYFTALQSQINPHFINNTLHSVYYMAEISQEHNIMRMINALTSLLNSSLNFHEIMIPLAQEEQLIRSYLYIMEIRYGRMIQLIVDFPENVKNCKILKMLFQPLIENSIVHGFSEYTGEEEIRISCKEERGLLLFEVKDNGRGIAGPELDRIQRLLLQTEGQPKTRGIGLFNVHERLYLYFQDKSHFSIQSVPGKMTCVSFSCPAIRSEDEIPGQMTGILEKWSGEENVQAKEMET